MDDHAPKEGGSAVLIKLHVKIAGKNDADKTECKKTI